MLGPMPGEWQTDSKTGILNLSESHEQLNVIAHTAETVPAAKFHVLVSALEEKSEEAAALAKALSLSNRQIRSLQREIDDLLDQAADRETIRKCLEFWRKRTDRPKARIDLSTGRAKHVRWVCRHDQWGPRGFCVAVVGLMGTPWFVQHGKTDVPHLVGFYRGIYDEARFESFLVKGRTMLGVDQ